MDPALGPQRLKPSRVPSRRQHSVLSPAREENDSRFPEGVIQRSAGAESAHKTFYGSMLFKKRGWGISFRPRRTRSRYTTCAWRVGVLLPLIVAHSHVKCRPLVAGHMLAACCWPASARESLPREASAYPWCLLTRLLISTDSSSSRLSVPWETRVRLRTWRHSQG